MRFIHLKHFLKKIKGATLPPYKKKHFGRNQNFSPKKKDGGKKY